MPEHHRHYYHCDPERDAEDRKKMERQRTMNNLLGILVLIIILAFACNLGGIATSVAHYLFRG